MKRFLKLSATYLAIAAIFASILVTTGANRAISGSKTQKSQIAEFRFVVLADSRGTDNGVDSIVVKKTLGEVKKLSPQPKFAVIPGDLIDGGLKVKELKSKMDYFKKIITSFYPVNFYYPGIGNHEVMHNPAGEKVFSEVFKEFKANFLQGYKRTVYYFDYGSTRLFMLNSDHPGEMHTISGKQLEWLKVNISPDKKHHVFFMHEPSYPTGYHIGNSLDVDKYKRNILWEEIDDSNDPIVFCGHEHFYSRRHIDAGFNESIEDRNFKYNKYVYQVTVGGFGGPLVAHFLDKKGVDVPPIAQYHYAVVDVLKTSIRVRVYNLNGKILDDFTY